MMGVTFSPAPESPGHCSSYCYARLDKKATQGMHFLEGDDHYTKIHTLAILICEIYDIGTEVKKNPCYFTTYNGSFRKSIIFSGIGNSFCILSDGSIKTRLKAFWDNGFESLHATLDSQLMQSLGFRS